MADKKIIAVTGATGAQGGGLVRAVCVATTASSFFENLPAAKTEEYPPRISEAARVPLTYRFAGALNISPSTHS